MFKKSEELRRAVDAVVEFAKKIERSGTLLTKDIERVGDCQAYHGRWNAMIRKVRNRILRERGIALRPIINLGYRFCEHEEQVRYCARMRQKRAIRQINRGSREVSAVDSSALSLHYQRLRALSMNSMQEEARTIRKGMRLSEDHNRPTETIPQRPRHVAAE